MCQFPACVRSGHPYCRTHKIWLAYLRAEPKVRSTNREQVVARMTDLVHDRTSKHKEKERHE